MLRPTDCPMNGFSLLTLTLEYSLPQSWREWNWRFWSYCPGWCSESEPEVENTRVSNYPGKMFVHGCSTKCLSSGNFRNTIVSVYGQHSALIVEYSLPQSWKEWNWRFWSHYPGWYSESEPELDNTGVSNCLDLILTYTQSVMTMIWLSWSLCGFLVLWQLVLVAVVTFLTVWTLLVKAIP